MNRAWNARPMSHAAVAAGGSRAGLASRQRASPADGKALAAVHRLAAADLARAGNTGLHRSASLARAPTGEAIELASGDVRRAFAGLDETGSPVGFSQVEPDGHVRFLCIDPVAAGRGVNSGLLQKLGASAKTDSLEQLFPEASETALPVFIKPGFRMLRRRNFETGRLNSPVFRQKRRSRKTDPTISQITHIKALFQFVRPWLERVI